MREENRFDPLAAGLDFSLRFALGVVFGMALMAANALWQIGKTLYIAWKFREV